MGLARTTTADGQYALDALCISLGGNELGGNKLIPTWATDLGHVLTDHIRHGEAKI